MQDLLINPRRTNFLEELIFWLHWFESTLKICIFLINCVIFFCRVLWTGMTRVSLGQMELGKHRAQATLFPEPCLGGMNDDALRTWIWRHATVSVCLSWGLKYDFMICSYVLFRVHVIAPMPPRCMLLGSTFDRMGYRAHFDVPLH